MHRSDRSRSDASSEPRRGYNDRNAIVMRFAGVNSAGHCIPTAARESGGPACIAKLLKVILVAKA
jgi:hypothetical protein